MDVDSNDPGTQTIITKGPSGNSQIIHVRQDSASELEALFNTVMNPSLKSKSQSLPMKSRKLPKSFFMQPDRPRQSSHFHHSHSQSMGGLIGSSQPAINHSRSSSSDSSASHASANAASNSNNNNGASVSSPGIPPGSPMNAGLNQKVAYSFSPAQRRVAHSQYVNARNQSNLQISQVSHSRSKSSPASFQLLDIANLQVKASDIPQDMPLPHGWSAAKTPDGQQYFMNHNNRTTTWEDPRIAIIKQQRQVALQNQTLAQPPPSSGHQTNIHNSNVPNDLSMEPFPPGWEQAMTTQGEIYYIDHQTQTTSWTDPRLQNSQQSNGNQQNNTQLQQQLLKVNQMDMANSGGVGRSGLGQQSMIKHLIQDKEITMRRHLLKQQLSSGGVDPFLGSSNPNFHQRDPSLDSGLGMGSNYNIPRSSDDYLANVEEMDTGDVTRRLHNAPPSHMVTTNNHQAQHSHGNPSRFPDFLDTLPASNVDFTSNNAVVQQQQAMGQPCPNSTGAATLDSGELVPTLQETLPPDFDVESMLNVKTENVDSGMVWL